MHWIWLGIISVLFSFGNLKADFNDKLKKFHVCTVANFMHPNLTKLIKTSKNLGIEVEVIGMNRPYYHNATKLVYLREYLNKLRDDDIVMFIDAFDVLIIQNKKTILEKFLKANQPFIMSAERNCYPKDFYPNYHPNNPKYKVKNFVRDKSDWTKHQYINTGSYIAYVKNIKQWIDDLNPDKHDSDQRQVQRLYFAKPDKRHFVLDYKCDLFMPMAYVESKDVEFKDRKVFNLKTHTYPAVIHTNGSKAKFWFDKVYNRIFGNSVLLNKKT